MNRVVPIIDIPYGIVHVGEDRVIQIPIRDVNGAPQSMTGWAVEYWVTTKAGDAAYLIRMRTVDGDVFFTNGDAVNDILNLSFADDDTMTGATVTVPAGEYAHGAKRADAGFESVLFTGTLYLTAAAPK